MFVQGGFLEVQPNRVTVLADTAIRAHDLDEAKAIEAKKRAEEAMANQDSAENLAAAQAELRPRSRNWKRSAVPASRRIAVVVGVDGKAVRRAAFPSGSARRDTAARAFVALKQSPDRAHRDDDNDARGAAGAPYVEGTIDRAAPARRPWYARGAAHEG